MEKFNLSFNGWVAWGGVIKMGYVNRGGEMGPKKTHILSFGAFEKTRQDSQAMSHPIAGKCMYNQSKELIDTGKGQQKRIVGY